MNKNRLIFAILIIVFLIGMVLTPVSASHTYKKGGYKFTVSNSVYKEITYWKKHRYYDYLYIDSVKLKGPKKTVKYKYYYSGRKWRYIYKKEKCDGFIYNSESGKPVIKIQARHRTYYTATAVSKTTWIYKL